jgi:hypothetical protein
MQAQIAALPLSGTDTLIVGGVALALTGIGFALRRLSRPRVVRVGTSRATPTR